MNSNGNKTKQNIHYILENFINKVPTAHAQIVTEH